MAEIVLNKQYNAGDRSDLRCLGAFTAEGGVSSGGGGTLASVSTRTLTQDVAVTGATVAITSLGGVALAGSTINGVIVRNVTAIVCATATNYAVGDTGTAAKWASAVPLTIDATSTGSDFAVATVPSKAHATNPIVLTATGGTFTSGTVRVQASVTTYGAPPK